MNKINVRNRLLIAFLSCSLVVPQTMHAAGDYSEVKRLEQAGEKLNKVTIGLVATLLAVAILNSGEKRKGANTGKVQIGSDFVVRPGKRYEPACRIGLRLCQGEWGTQAMLNHAFRPAREELVWSRRFE